MQEDNARKRRVVIVFIVCMCGFKGMVSGLWYNAISSCVCVSEYDRKGGIGIVLDLYYWIAVIIWVLNNQNGESIATLYPPDLRP